MDTTPREPESFRSLLLRCRGRTGMVQREVAARAGISLRSLQEWEAGDKFPTAERLQALVEVLLEAGGFTVGRELSEASQIWTAVQQQSARMHVPFDEEWFRKLLSARLPMVSEPARNAPRSAR